MLYRVLCVLAYIHCTFPTFSTYDIEIIFDESEIESDSISRYISVSGIGARFTCGTIIKPVWGMVS